MSSQGVGGSRVAEEPRDAETDPPSTDPLVLWCRKRRARGGFRWTKDSFIEEMNRCVMPCVFTCMLLTLQLDVTSLADSRRNRYKQKAYNRLWEPETWKEHEVYVRKLKYDIQENECCNCGLDDIKSIFCRGYRCYAAEIGVCNDRYEPGMGSCSCTQGAFEENGFAPVPLRPCASRHRLFGWSFDDEVLAPVPSSALVAVHPSPRVAGLI